MALTLTHPNRRVLRRFFGNVSVMPSGCWHWEGAFSGSGYGSSTWNYTKTSAHRIAYWWFVRQPLKEEVVDHLCRNIRCVNPAHLEAVSQSENLRRGISARAGELREEWRRKRYQIALARLAADVDVVTEIRVRRSA